MVNKIAAAGAVVCIVATALSCGLLTTDEFVEVFVADGNGGTSCAIGFLGVNNAGFDASCLSTAELEASGLGGENDAGRFFNIEAFDAPTEEFKLLFPTQQDFFYEINPFYSQYLACIEEGGSFAGVPCSETLRQAIFPTFAEKDNDCDAYWGQLLLTQADGATGVFPNGQTEVDQLVLGSFAQLPVLSLLEPYYEGNVTGGSLFLLGGLVEAALIGNGVIAAFPTDTTSLIAMFNVIDSGAVTVPTLGTDGNALINRIVSNALNISAATRIGCVAAGDLGSCIVGILDTIGALPESAESVLPGAPAFAKNFLDNETYPTLYCQIVLGLAGPSCDITDLVSLIDAFTLEQAFLDVLPVETQELVAGIQAAFFGLPQLYQLFLTGNMTFSKFVFATPFDFTGLAFASPAAFAQATFLQLLAETGGVYPADKDAGGYQYCEILKNVGAYTTNVTEILSLTCSFQFFIESAANAAIAAGASDDLVGLAGPLVTLFGFCFELIDNVLAGVMAQAAANGTPIPLETAKIVAAGTPGLLVNPNQCWAFFPAALVNVAFSAGLTDTFALYNATDDPAGAATFTAAAASCKDDIKDLEAIETAQSLSPVGIVFLGIGALFAVVAVGVNNKIVAGVAGVTELLGALLVVIALLTVYNAPIYASVGSSDDADSGEIIYLAGRTVALGLWAIILGAVGGTVMIVSVFFFSAASDAEAKALGAAEEKPVSI
mmetsp:Transcript_6691/g.7677  ORF Transcript_6691/g.7677 Transcript_6691/m.7677 type:complete len:719 (-) Transcript_6691:131-2287(-)